MKQILIITRISSSSGDNEFNEFFPNRNKPISEKFNDLTLTISNGLDFYDDKNSQLAIKIKEKINSDAAEVLIVIHYSGFTKLRDALNRIKNDANWQIRQYSGEDDNYESKIKPLFQGLIDDNSNVQEIYKLFSRDSILEAKLELLDKIKNGEAKQESLDEKIKDYQQSFDVFIKNNTDFFSVIKKIQNGNEDEKKESEKALDEYKRAYDNFYDSLGLEN